MQNKAKNQNMKVAPTITAYKPQTPKKKIVATSRGMNRRSHRKHDSFFREASTVAALARLCSSTYATNLGLLILASSLPRSMTELVDVVRLSTMVETVERTSALELRHASMRLAVRTRA